MCRCIYISLNRPNSSYRRYLGAGMDAIDVVPIVTLLILLLLGCSYGNTQDLLLSHKKDGDDIILVCTFPHHSFNKDGFRAHWKERNKNTIITFTNNTIVPVADGYKLNHEANILNDGISLRIKEFKSLPTKLSYTCMIDDNEGLISETSINSSRINDKDAITSDSVNVQDKPCQPFIILLIILVVIVVASVVCVTLFVVKSGRWRRCKDTADGSVQNDDDNVLHEKEKKTSKKSTNADPVNPSDETTELPENKAKTNTQSEGTEADNTALLSSKPRTHPYDDVELKHDDKMKKKEESMCDERTEGEKYKEELLATSEVPLLKKNRYHPYDDVKLK